MSWLTNLMDMTVEMELANARNSCGIKNNKWGFA
jgi:hypothetical protein